MSRNHLFLTLCKRGWGEAILGLRLAWQLHERGDTVSFLGHDSLSLLFKGTPFTYDVLDDSFGRIIHHFVRNVARQKHPVSIVLCDLFTTSVYLEDVGVDAAFLAEVGARVVGIDTWGFEEAGNCIDVLPGRKKTVAPWAATFRHRLLPVPVLRGDPRPGIYSNAPAAATASADVRTKIRSDLGLSHKDRAILFSTARWQHPPFPGDSVRRLAQALPELIAHYIRRLGTSVRLVHVGPQELGLESILGDNYLWIPPVSSKEFDLLLSSVDLLISPNISATTVTKALASGIPAVVFQNSLQGSTIEEVLSQVPDPRSELIRSWLLNVVPLYAFSLWPLSWYEFLSPVLRRNEYFAAVRVLELLREEEAIDTLWKLLFSQEVRSAQIRRQGEYFDFLRSLPSGADALGAQIA